jgi:hypothetical protein
MFDLVSQSTLIAIAGTGARTASGNGAAVDVRELFGIGAVVLDCAAGTGTNPTLSVVIQDSDDGATGWASISGAAFAQVTNAASSVQLIGLDLSAARRFVRASWTVGGTTPSFTFSVNALGRKAAP